MEVMGGCSATYSRELLMEDTAGCGVVVIGRQQHARAVWAEQKRAAAMALPRLQKTLLADILGELPEETAQLQDAVLAIASKYRADLHAQLEQTRHFQEHVTRTHEKVHRRLKRTARVIEDTGRRAKVDGSQPGKVLCDDVEALAQDVMGKLMGIVDLLGDTGSNIDGDKYPLLKKVMGQEGFEVVQIPSNVPSVDGVEDADGAKDNVGEDTSTSIATLSDPINQNNTNAEMDAITLNETSRELQSVSIAPSRSIESSDHDEEPTTEDQTDSNSEEELTHEENSSQIQDDAEPFEQGAETVAADNEENEQADETEESSVAEHKDPNSEPSIDPPQNDVPKTPNVLAIETEVPKTNDSTPTPTEDATSSSKSEDELSNIESTIARYKSTKLRSFPMPVAPSITSLSSVITTTSTSSAQGVTYSPSVSSATSLNESLKKFI